MNRFKIVALLTVSLIVLSSCSRRYGHLMRRSSGSDRVVQKTDQRKTSRESDAVVYAEESEKTETLNESNAEVTQESVEVVNTSAVVINSEKSDETSQSSQNGQNVKKSLKSRLKEAKSEIPANIVGKRLRKKVETIRELRDQKINPETEMSNENIIYIILVVLLVLLVLELIGKLFGGYFLGIIGLVLLIVLIGWLLGWW